MIVGLVGKPSAGKSTFFKAATLAEVEIANYPFTTIEKNEGVGFVKVECADKDFNVQCNPRFGYCMDHKRFVPIQLIDVAGLVPGAHEGKGRGNQFLDDLRQADVLIHVVDISGSIDENGKPVDAGSYDPAKDITFLEEEIDMWYLGILKKGWERFTRQIKQENIEIHKALAKQLSGLKVTEEMVQDSIKRLGLGQTIGSWTDEHMKQLATELRRLTKPIMIAANKIDMGQSEENYKRVRDAFPDYKIIPCSAEAELALKEAAKKELIEYIPGESKFEMLKEDSLSDKQKKALEFIQKNVLKKFNSTGVQDILDLAVFDILKYIVVFPGGVNKLQDSEGRVLPDCFLLPPGSTALDFAYSLHTDFGKNFVKAIDVRTKKVVGKDHKLQNRDVIEIMANK
ncbi:MAG: redox-regulated ATPase YchF [Nanoarchaeota archaeon]|nr:redox-regulated ATPase YchF [Nanoarchaeota archaeon]MCG2717826.1 redox-regulated ATPase YchF [Nanoarchaeota archaeon]